MLHICFITRATFSTYLHTLYMLLVQSRYCSAAATKTLRAAVFLHS